jgi:tetratricopeptide (TPR) repeat protein
MPVWKPQKAQLGRIAAVVGVAVALTAGSMVLGGSGDSTGSGPAVRSAAALDTTSAARLSSGDLGQGIAALQARLKKLPEDSAGWATLGAAYVEQARTNGDPTRYTQADSAFARSLEISPAQDNDAAVAGKAALAAARHEFTDALTYADQALKVNPYSEHALASRIDALVELGRYDDARTAAQLADKRRPGIPVFTRYAYVMELTGDIEGTRRVLELALRSATTPSDIAYVATMLGQLAWTQGDYTEAQTQYTKALAAQPDNLQALEGRGRTYAAQGKTAQALEDLEEVVRRYPLPGQLAELGELYEVTGKKDKAAEQYEVVRTWTWLARANGANTDLETALIEADHGDKAEALKAARAEFARRKSVHTADALAWALHVNGQDKEALPLAEQAAASGYRNAAFLYHRGMIEKSLGDKAGAVRDLKAALKLNTGFSPTGSLAAKAALKDLESEK